MVYGGAPSKGCSACRRRKIRCDQQPSGCSQCTRGRRKCPGYRDQLELVFINQSEHIANKVQSTAASRLRQQSERANIAGRSETPQLSTYSLSPSNHDRATGFFFSHYVVAADGPTEGHFDGLRSIAYEVDDHLLASIKAVGFAGLSGVTNTPSLMREAREQYLTAIRQINSALSSVADAKKDSTLFATLILGLFERVAGSTSTSVTAWANHINGAATLLKLRGAGQFNSIDGRRIFIQVTSSLLTWCVQAEVALPAHILEFGSDLAMQANYAPELAWRFLESMLPFTQFRAAVRCGEITDPEAILSRALELDELFVSMFTDVPEGWRYQILYTNTDPDEVFAGYYHVYTKFETVRIWNSMRCARLLLQEMICTVSVAENNTEMLKRSADIIFQLQRDVLASVPQHTGYSGTGPKSGRNSPKRKGHALDSAGGDRDKKCQLMFRGYILIWGLYVAGSMEITSESARVWTINKLQWVGRVMGIQQALALADILEKKVQRRGLFDPNESMMSD